MSHQLSRIGVLLVNLGTPDSPSIKDVRKYLLEFLLDPKVIDLPWLQRNLLVRGIIVPFRTANSAKCYKAIWTKNGSPLLFHSKNLQAKLQKLLGENFIVELSMCYQSPSIKSGLENLKRAEVKKIIVLPLFPQYAEASTGSVIQKVKDEIQKMKMSSEIVFIKDFYANEKMIKSFCENANKYGIDNFDHLLFSFHGLPERQIKKTDPSNHCFQNKNCCDSIAEKNRFCYRAQCFTTAKLLVEKLNLPEEKYTICFQSRLGKDPWIKPYTDKVIHQLAEQGVKKILVFCPAFVADCLETVYEISVENSEIFKNSGGEKLQLVESLNSNDLWVEAVKEMIMNC